MTRSLWVHCGTYKTGTTAIQQQAWEHRDALLAQGWLYPLAGLRTDDPDVGMRHGLLPYAEGAEADLLVDRIGDEIASSSARHVLLSSEAWSRPQLVGTLALLVRRLRERGLVDDVHGVLYLRNRAAYARSFYREYNRRRDNVRPFPAFLVERRRLFDYADVVSSLESALAPGALQVHPYDAIPGDVDRHFFSLLGVSLPAAARSGRVNPSLDALDSEATRQLNLLAPGTAAHWPGWRSLVTPELDPSGATWTEKFSGDAASLPALPHWTAAQVAELDDDAVLGGRDVTTDGSWLVRGLVERWLHESCVREVSVDVFPHPLVSDLVLPAVGDAVQQRLSGKLLTSSPLPADARLLAVGATSRQARLGLPSPGFARRHPGRGDAESARFLISRATFDEGGRLDLVLALPTGERLVLASWRRTWRVA